MISRNDYDQFAEFFKTVSNNSANVSRQALQTSQQSSHAFLKLCDQTLNGSNQRLQKAGLSSEERNQERQLQEKVLAMGSAVCMKTQDTSNGSLKSTAKLSKHVLCAFCFLILVLSAVYIASRLLPPEPETSSLDSPEEVCYIEGHDIEAEEDSAGLFFRRA